MTTTAAKIEPQQPPLARDLHGNAVAFPDGTTAWRICRQTTGRPREIVGHDKQVLRFPLETTCDELVSMCGRDVYRVYALDEVGKQLDYVTTLDLTGEVRELRNAGEMPASRALVPSSMTPTSDLRPMARRGIRCGGRASGQGFARSGGTACATRSLRIS